MCVHQDKMVRDLLVTVSWENRLKTLCLNRLSASASLRQVLSSGTVPTSSKGSSFQSGTLTLLLEILDVRFYYRHLRMSSSVFQSTFST